MRTNPTEPASSALLQPATWPTWLAWVLVSALVPVFSAISETAFNKQIARNAGHPTLIATGLLAVTALAMLAPPLMQGFVLRRVTPKLSVGMWFVCILLSGILWLALTA